MRDGGVLVVTTRKGSDFWRTTAYGFDRDSGHALLVPFPDDCAVEITFDLDYEEQFDQAGVLVRASPTEWVKAGVEVSDRLPHVGAVATRQLSDWSLAPVPDWAGRQVTIRASRSGDALTLRARVADGRWQLVRVAPVPAGAEVLVGPYCCSPTRAGLQVRFGDLRFTPADAELHPQ